MEELREKAAPEVAEKLKEWKPDEMSRSEQEKFVRSLLLTATKAHYDYKKVLTCSTRSAEETVIPGEYAISTVDHYSERKYVKDKEPWRPEYDDMCLLFLPQDEIEKYQKKGMSREKIVKKAKEQILTAMWQEYREHGHDAFFSREGKDGNKYMIYQKQQSKRFYEEDAFNDDAVGNTLYAIVMKDRLRPLLRRESDFGKLQEALTRAEGKDYEIESFRPNRSNYTPFVKRKDPLIDGIKVDSHHWFPNAKERAQDYANDGRLWAIKKDLTFFWGDNIGDDCLSVLNSSGYGVNFESMGNVASSIDLKKKRIILNSPALKEAQTLSMINAACFLKQEIDKAGMSEEDMAIRKADALVAQMKYAKQWGNDYIYKSILKWNGYGDLFDVYDKAYQEASALQSQKREACKEYQKEFKGLNLNNSKNYIDDMGKETCSRKHVENAAYSAVVDAYLDKALKGKKPSFEKIGTICHGFDGQPYYSGRNYFESKNLWKSEDCDYYRSSEVRISTKDRGLKKKDVIVDNPVNAAFIVKAKQKGR
ncbi:MAG: hypothetical protein IKR09_06380 [Alphaproteobacteria bacterium]|nr:hypothetical protein [Alphaproteobacteria bacterium]